MLLVKDEVQEVLGKYWDERIAEAVGVADQFDLGSGLDSVATLSVLVEMERKFGLQPLPARLIKRGGYESREEFVKHLYERLERYLAGEQGTRCDM